MWLPAPKKPMLSSAQRRSPGSFSFGDSEHEDVVWPLLTAWNDINQQLPSLLCFKCNMHHNDNVLSSCLSWRFVSHSERRQQRSKERQAWIQLEGCVQKYPCRHEPSLMHVLHPAKHTNQWDSSSSTGDTPVQSHYSHTVTGCYTLSVSLMQTDPHHHRLDVLIRDRPQS